MSASIHPDSRIGNVYLRVSNLERSLRFYTEVVGMRVLEEGNGAAILGAEDGRRLLRLREVEHAIVPPRRSAAGLYHFAILLPDRKSLGLVLRHLLAAGVHVGHSDHLVSEALYIADPDNNGIELYADRPQHLWRRDAKGEYAMALDPIDKEGLLREAGDTPWSGLPAGTTIGHIHLHVSDLAAAQRFYHDVLGFNIMGHMADSALFIAAGDYHHHIGLNIWAGQGAQLAPDNATGLDRFEIVVPDKTALDEIVFRLQQAGIPFEAAPDTLALHDSSGIALQIMV
ncbi:VOC family protein [Paenibacillus cymbidii]|uniref:VOC family protein n=1 Tax=Paenibacillus cymbidii TaxID=1639034 RepID=UPI0010803E49|nr:VOC family protein [Paenibacillus cymbidii]